ncbi:MAG: hypothetical protein IT381_14340 [Deltaproteobacteria bacterium]|nr:hypothetical protein [Deltaproteobacteria bacterium]
MSTHPSFFMLDRAGLGDAAAKAQIAEHLETCGVCRAHLQALAAPANELALQRIKRAPSPARPLVPRWIMAAAAAAVVSVIGIGLANVLSDRGDVVTAKGAPSVAVYVKRGDTVFLWNGRAPLRANDTIRLKIVPEEMRFVEVRDASGAVLYKGELTPPETTLPVAWRIDEQGEAEHLTVWLGRAPGAEMKKHVELVLPKEAP